MSARNCPKCQRELPVEILRALEQGTSCPHCATRLKRAPRPSPSAAPADNNHAAFQVSQTPPVTARPTDDDSYKWFQTKGSPGAGAAAAAVSRAAPVAAMPPPAPAPATTPPAPARSPLKSLPSVGMPGLTPATGGSPAPVRPAPALVQPSPVAPAKTAPAPAPVPPSPVAPAKTAPAPAPVPPSPVAPVRTAAATVAPTEIQKRPAPLDLSPPIPPVEPRRAPTIIGTAPPPAERHSAPAPAPAPMAPAAALEPPRAPLARTALPSSASSTASSTLAVAAPVLAFPPRSRRNIAVAAATAAATVAVAMLFLHRSPGDLRAPIAPPAVKLPVGAAPLVATHETSTAAPALQPLHADPETAGPRPADTVPPVEQPSADLGRDTAGIANAAGHAKVRIAHHATAHQRRSAKHEKHEKREKRARHERRHAHRTEVASRAAPSAADDGEARASYQRGNALLFAGDAAGAVAAYQKAVELAPADPIGYRGLGLAHEQQGDTGAAVRALRKYLKLAPGAADREIISRRIARLSQGAGHP